MLDSHSMITGLRAGAALVGALLFATLITFLTTAGTHAQEPLAVTFQTPKDGQVIGEKPFVLQMCFSRPINIKDLDKGGDFRFDLFDDANLGYGLRVVFQPDGWGVSIYPGPAPVLSPAPSPIRDNWVFSWHVVAADDGTPNDGEIKFKVDASAEPIPGETPPSCLPGGGTGTPGPTGVPDVTPTPGGSVTPTSGPTAEPSGEPSPTEEPPEESGGGDDLDTEELILLTLGAFGLLAVAGLVAYWIRRRVGYEPHAPEQGSGETGDNH